MTYHCSLRLFTMVRRSSCGPIACWILAWSSLLLTWSLCEMHSILQCKAITPEEMQHHYMGTVGIYFWLIDRISHKKLIWLILTIVSAKILIFFFATLHTQFASYDFHQPYSCYLYQCNCFPCGQLGEIDGWV